MIDKNKVVAELCQSKSHPVIRSPQWSIKLHSGSSETLQQYRVNLTAMAVYLDRLADHGEVYWVLQGKHHCLFPSPQGFSHHGITVRTTQWFPRSINVHHQTPQIDFMYVFGHSRL